MKPNIRWWATGVAAVVASMLALRAAQPEVPPGRNSGKILVLDNERVIEGRIEREGDRYRVRRQSGETVLPGSCVLYLCDTLPEAYAFLRSRANLRDVDERLRLARWCQLHGLHEDALINAQAALKLNPDNGPAQRLLTVLQRTNAHNEPAKAKNVVSFKQSPAPAKPTIEVDAATMGQFVKRVQPILMNTCASCHLSGQAGTFKLARALNNGMLDRQATQQNLDAVLAQIQPANWTDSPLLMRAVSVHGPASLPPLRGRSSPAFRYLEDWVRQAVASTPQLADQAKTGVKSSDMNATSLGARAPNGATDFHTAGPAAAPKPATATPTATLRPLDPFDPGVFNQQRKPR